MYSFNELYDFALKDTHFEFSKTIKEPEFETFTFDGIEFFVDKQMSTSVVLKYYQQIKEILGNPKTVYNGRLYIVSHPPCKTARGQSTATLQGRHTDDGPCLMLTIDTRCCNYELDLYHEMVHVVDCFCNLTNTTGTDTTLLTSKYSQKAGFHRSEKNNIKYVFNWVYENAFANQLEYSQDPAEALVYKVFLNTMADEHKALDYAHGVVETALLQLDTLKKEKFINKKVANAVKMALFKINKDNKQRYKHLIQFAKNNTKL